MTQGHIAKCASRHYKLNAQYPTALTLTLTNSCYNNMGNYVMCLLPEAGLLRRHDEQE